LSPPEIAMARKTQLGRCLQLLDATRADYCVLGGGLNWRECDSGHGPIEGELRPAPGSGVKAGWEDAWRRALREGTGHRKISE
jgi:hypothetical protein